MKFSNPVQLTSKGKKWAKIIGLFLLFVVAVHIGQTHTDPNAAKAPQTASQPVASSTPAPKADNGPDAASKAVLAVAKANGGQSCRVEWSETYQAWDVVCAHPLSIISNGRTTQITNLDADNDPQK